MLQPFKPHVFINHAAGTFTFLINTNSNNGNYTLNTTPTIFNDPYQNGVLVHEYRMNNAGGTVPQSTITGNLPAAGTGNYIKLSIRILFPNDDAAGSVTVNIKLQDHFTHDGTGVFPYCWIKSLPVPATKVFFLTMIPDSILPNQPTEILLLPAKNKIILNYVVPVLGANPNNLFSERNYNLSDFDPAVYNFIEVMITEEDSARNTRKKKGSGTTSQSDADSSDDN